MRFELEQRFCGSVEDVAALFDDPRLLERLAEAQTLCRAELLERSENDAVVRQRVRYAYTGTLSPAARAIVDPSALTWVEESEFDRRTLRRQFRIVPEHDLDRLRCEGVAEFQTEGGRTRRLTRGKLEVRVPVAGTKVADAIVSGLREFALVEAAVVQQWLDERYPANPERPFDVRSSEDDAATGAAGNPLVGLLREYSEGWQGAIHGVQRFVGDVRDTMSAAVDTFVGRRR